MHSSTRAPAESEQLERLPAGDEQVRRGRGDRTGEDRDQERHVRRERIEAGGVARTRTDRGQATPTRRPKSKQELVIPRR